MHFVGRDEEIQCLWQELQGGHHVILSGAYGIGRTRLLQRVAELHRDEAKFVFLDYFRTNATTCRTILGVLYRPRRSRRRSGPTYKAAHFRILNFPPDTSGRRILVLDNVQRLTPPKIRLVQDLVISKHFQVVAIVESFLPGRDLEALRGHLNGVGVVTLGRLSGGDVREFLSRAAEEFGLGWSRSRIQGLASSLHGYPLGMVSAVERTLRGRMETISGGDFFTPRAASKSGRGAWKGKRT